MKFSIREHRLCHKSNTPDPEYKYEENLFGNLPNGSLFVDKNGDKEELWIKQGNTRVHITQPSERDMAKFRQNHSQYQYSQTVHAELAGLLPQGKNLDFPPTGRIENKMEDTDVVEVAYIPLTSEIRSQCEQVLRQPLTSHSLPDSLRMMLEREELLLAEKARNRDQSIILEHPSNNLQVVADWNTVPVDSFFTTSKRPHDDSMVYMKSSPTSCNAMCDYRAWNEDLLGATCKNEFQKIEDVLPQAGREPVSVCVLSTLTPGELERLTTIHHEKLAKNKVTITEAQRLFEEDRKKTLTAFWTSIA
jgi:hypothetical protein